MIHIKPAWRGDKAEDIWALYYFLLYKIFPFEPCDFLPRDKKGFYYFEEGNRNKQRIYPKKSGKKFVLHSYTKKFLEREAFSSEPSSLEELIMFVSPDLHNYLYLNTNNTVNRTNLRNLLTMQTDQETIEQKKLNFNLNPKLLEKNSRRKKITDQYKIDLWKILLVEIFNYDLFSKEKFFPKLIQMLEVNVCPYCNRAFTNTIQKKDGSYYRQNQVDHYRAKSLYPWFALTLPNFIPSCGSCNQKKGDEMDFVLYPYIEEFGSNYFFRTRPISGVGYLIGSPDMEEEFEIEIVQQIDEDLSVTSKANDYMQRVQRSIEKFGLDILYGNSHNSYVSFMFEQRYIFNDAYIDSLISSFPEYFNNREDIQRLLYLKEYDKDTLDRAPLAKLTHDIDNEITRLTR